MSIRLKDTIYNTANYAVDSDKLDGYDSSHYMQYKNATTAATAQWYRIAQSASGISHNIGTFQIAASTSSYHTDVTLVAGTCYGNTAGTSIIQIGCATYSGMNLTKARIVYHTTHSGNYAYLEVYHSRSATANISVKFFGHGWTLVAPSTVGSVPDGYSTKEITFTKDAIVAPTFVGALSGNASTATSATSAGKLTTARTISLTGSVTGSGSFDGSANLSITTTTNHTHNYAGSSSAGGAATSANKLATARTLWGQSFNGTANVSGDMTGVGSISMSKALTLTGTDSSTSLISFSRQNYNYITFPTGYSLAFGVATGSANTLYRMTNEAFIPERTNEVSLGTSSLKWSNVYATTFTGALSGNASSSTYTTNIRVTSTNPTSATNYGVIWAANSSTTSSGGDNYTPRANNGFIYRTLEGTTSALGYGISILGNSTASGTAGNKYGILRLYSESSGYVNITPGTSSTSNYTLYLPGAGVDN